MSEGGRISRIGLRNFKPFRYLGDIELRPLTVLCGANSTGKSSLLQSLLLLKQSSQDGSFEGALRFKGKYIENWDFDTIVSGFDTSLPIEFRLGVDFPEGYGLSSASVRISIGLQNPAEHPDVREFELMVRRPGMGERHDIYLLVKNGLLEAAQNLRAPGTGISIPPKARIDFQGLWPSAIEVKIGDAETTAALPVAPGLFVVLGWMKQALMERLEYLGPVRADPRPFYPVDKDPDIECRGEGTIPYLLRHQRDRVSYRLSATGEPREESLLEALNAWLGALEITDRLTIKPVESIALTAAISTPTVKSRAIDLAQVGFGISQILPVLTMGLKGPANGMLMYEQPEIHLHPRLQAGLADFLLCAARSGKTILLETHSDHLINRLRRRVAEDETGELAEAVQILFVHSGTEDDPGSYVEALRIDESGTINAPSDFFPEAADEAFALMAARRRKAGRGSA